MALGFRGISFETGVERDVTHGVQACGGEGLDALVDAVGTFARTATLENEFE